MHAQPSYAALSRDVGLLKNYSGGARGLRGGAVTPGSHLQGAAL